MSVQERLFSPKWVTDVLGGSDVIIYGVEYGKTGKVALLGYGLFCIGKWFVGEVQPHFVAGVLCLIPWRMLLGWKGLVGLVSWSRSFLLFFFYFFFFYFWSEDKFIGSVVEGPDC